MILCPLCQFQFNDREGCHGCGMTHGCTLIKCPNCAYEFVEGSKMLKSIERLWKKWFGKKTETKEGIQNEK